jgi:hypothetical protein
MYQSGQTALQSMGWLQTHSADRPTFQAKVTRGFSSRDYVVFAMEHGLLFLEHLDHPMTNRAGGGGGVNGAVVAGAILGGAVGAVIGGMLTSNGPDSPTRKESGLETLSDDELFALARSRKRSFVAERDEIESVSIDAPGMFSSMWGVVNIRDRKLGKLSLKIPNRTSMTVVIDAFPRHYANRTRINVRWDQAKNGFVRQAARDSG